LGERVRVRGLGCFNRVSSSRAKVTVAILR
jgi:hypothetical protein